MLSTLRILKSLACTLLLFFGLGGVQKALACHWASAELYVDYIGDGVNGCTGTTEYEYEITFVMYFACQDCFLEERTQYPGTIRSENLGLDTGTFLLNEISYDTVSQICPNFWNLNSCNDLTNKDKYPAYRRVIFRGIKTFPAHWTPQTDYVFAVSGGGRPQPNIKNITNGSLTVEAMINNLNQYNNSSPRFLSSPLNYKCVNQPAMFLNGPYDPNGDSVVVTNYTPLDFNSTPGGYKGAYSLTNLIDTDPSNPYKLDPITGTATFTATQTGTYQLAYMASKYQRGTGILLGYAMRDINTQILSCSEPPPAVDSIPPAINDGKVITTSTGARLIYTCPKNTLKFDVSSKAMLATSQVYLEAAMPGMPGATFNAPANGSSAVTGTFEWTPAATDVGDHTLIITSKDSTCSGSGYTIVQKTSTVYTIRVTPGIDLGPDIPICAINNTPKQLYVKGGDHLKLIWEEIKDNVVQPGTPSFLSNATVQNPIANPNRSVTYRVTTPDLSNQCTSVDFINLFVDTSTTVDAFPDNPVIMCKPDYLQLDARLKGDKPTGNIGCGTTKVIETIERDTVAILGSLAFGELAIYDTLGTNTPVLPNDVKTAKMEYLIDRKEIFAANMRSGTIKSIGFEVKDALGTTPQEYRNFTIKLKCTKLNKLNKSGGFQNDNTMTLVYTDPGPITFASNTSYHFTLDQPYSWDTTQNLIIQICYANENHQITCTNPKGEAPTLKFVPTEDVTALFLKAADTATKDVCASKTDPNIKEYTARPRFTFSYSEAPPEDYQIRWTGNLISDSTIQTPLAYIPRSITYHIQTYGRRGCIIRDSIEIYVPVRNYKIFPADTSICYGNDAVMKIDKGFFYKWYEYTPNGQYKAVDPSTIDCANCREVRVRPLATTNYRIVVYDSVWCTDTIEARVKVLPLPVVKLLNKDTIIRFGSSIQLLATGARQYNWMPSGSLSTPNTSAPIATPSERTTYVVAGIGANGCRSYDTLTVDVSKRENVFVPTAFSPNGDGKNDVFRVANMTFQRLMEFRVFNRWGQEIFATTDAKGGWDGTWNGEPQPVGNYRYMIRVGFPDGHNESYTGDVTLIR